MDKDIKRSKVSEYEVWPDTSEGGSVSKYNALKHGLLSKKVLLKGESRKNLISFRKNIIEELNPQTETEHLLCDRIIANSWRLRRVLEIEGEMIERQRIPYLNSYMSLEYPKKRKKETMENITISEEMEKLRKYEGSIERSIYKSLHELQRIQSARRGERPPAPVAIDVDVTKD